MAGTAPGDGAAARDDILGFSINKKIPVALPDFSNIKSKQSLTAFMSGGILLGGQAGDGMVAGVTIDGVYGRLNKNVKVDWYNGATVVAAVHDIASLGAAHDLQSSIGKTLRRLRRVERGLPRKRGRKQQQAEKATDERRSNHHGLVARERDLQCEEPWAPRTTTTAKTRATSGEHPTSRT